MTIDRAPEAGQPAPTDQTRPWRAALAGLVGAACAGLLYTHIPEDEGMVHRGYLDISGVPTKCAGDTRNVVVGRTYSKAECEESLGRALYDHAAPVLACIPTLRTGPGETRPYETYAIVSLAYNVGVDAACRSTAARHFRARRWREGCRALRRWVYDNGRRIRGLELRRDREIQRCLWGSAAR